MCILIRAGCVAPFNNGFGVAMLSPLRAGIRGDGLATTPSLIGLLSPLIPLFSVALREALLCRTVIMLLSVPLRSKLFRLVALSFFTVNSVRLKGSLLLLFFKILICAVLFPKPKNPGSVKYLLFKELKIGLNEEEYNLIIAQNNLVLLLCSRLVLRDLGLLRFNLIWLDIRPPANGLAFSAYSSA